MCAIVGFTVYCIDYCLYLLTFHWLSSCLAKFCVLIAASWFWGKVYFIPNIRMTGMTINPMWTLTCPKQGLFDFKYAPSTRSIIYNAPIIIHHLLLSSWYNMANLSLRRISQLRILESGIERMSGTECMCVRWVSAGVLAHVIEQCYDHSARTQHTKMTK